MHQKIRSVALAAAILAGVTSHATAADHPNILLIISDDIGVDVSSDMYPGLIDGLVKQYGPSGLNHAGYRAIQGKQAETPALNQLARQGMTFSNAWAAPFCSPTRASILTGLFSARTGVLTYAEPLGTHHFSFVKELKDKAGYSTALFGKWHVAGLGAFPGMKPKQAGFDVFRGNLGAAINTFWNYDYQIQDADTPADKWRSETPPMRSLPGIAETNYAPVVKVADTIDWITAQEQANPDKPWFVWLAFNLSHATSSRVPSQMIIPNADTLTKEAHDELKACGGVFGSANVGNCSGEAQMRGMTNSLDTIIGKMLAAVDRLDPNTYIIYVGDNGTPMYGRPGLDFIDNMYVTRTGRGKGTAFESGTRVPLAIRGPDIPKNTNSDAYVNSLDLFATILDLADLPVPKTVPNRKGDGTTTVDSVSLSPLLFDKAKSIRDADRGYMLTETINLMTSDRTRQAGARNGAYKIVCTNGYAASDCEFFNLLKDPLEEYPLAKPASCADYAAGRWRTSEERWQYCRLNEVIATESFMQPGYDLNLAPGPGLPPR